MKNVYRYNKCSEEQIEKFESGEYIKDPGSKKLFSENVKELKDFFESNLKSKLDSVYSYYKLVVNEDTLGRVHTLRLIFSIYDKKVAAYTQIVFAEKEKFNIYLNIYVGTKIVYYDIDKSIDELKQNFIEWLEEE